MKFTILVHPLICHRYFILNLSDPCPSVDKNKRGKIAFSLIYFHAPAQEPLSRESWNFKFLVSRLYLGYYYILSFSNLYLVVGKKIFKEIMHFHYMTYMAQELLPWAF